MITVPVDARALAIATARAVLADRPEEYAAGVIVRGHWPESSTPGSTTSPPPLPFVLVHVDGQQTEWPHTQRPNLRFTCYHRDVDAGHDLAALLCGLLLAGPRGPLEQPVLVVAPFADRDEHRGPYGSFTVSAAITPGDAPG
jgi:hypothetical protein